jgi:hypothetical protein
MGIRLWGVASRRQIVKTFYIRLNGQLVLAFDDRPAQILAWDATDAISIFRRDPVMAGAKAKPSLKGAELSAEARQ